MDLQTARLLLAAGFCPDLAEALPMGEGEGRFELRVRSPEGERSVELRWRARPLEALRAQASPRARQALAQLGRHLMLSLEPGRYLERFWHHPRIVMESAPGAAWGWAFSALKPIGPDEAELFVVRWERLEAPAMREAPQESLMRGAADLQMRARAAALEGRPVGAAVLSRQAGLLIAEAQASLPEEAPAVERLALGAERSGALLCGGDLDGARRAWMQVDRLQPPLSEGYAALTRRRHLETHEYRQAMGHERDAEWVDAQLARWPCALPLWIARRRLLERLPVSWEEAERMVRWLRDEGGAPPTEEPVPVATLLAKPPPRKRARKRKKAPPKPPEPSAPLLRAAVEHLQQAHPALALEALRRAWASDYDPEVARLYDAVSAHVGGALKALPRSRSRAQRQANWLEVAKAGRALDVPRLLAALQNETLPQRLLNERLDALRGRAPDPLLARTAVGMLEQLYGLGSTYANKVRAFVEAQPAPHLRPRIEAWLAGDLGFTSVAASALRFRERLRKGLKTAPELRPAEAPVAAALLDLQPLVAALAQAEVPSEAQMVARLDAQNVDGAGAELLEACYRDPTDLDARTVYGDWLGERGDPWGAVIALQSRPEPDAKAEAKLLAAHLEDWLGPLHACVVPGSLRLRRGFLDQAALHFDWVGARDSALADPRWRTLRTLVASDRRVLTHRHMKQVEALGIEAPFEAGREGRLFPLPAELFARIASRQKPWPYTRLVLDWTSQLDLRAFPKLERLSLSARGLTDHGVLETLRAPDLCLREASLANVALIGPHTQSLELHLIGGWWWRVIRADQGWRWSLQWTGSAEAPLSDLPELAATTTPLGVTEVELSHVEAPPEQLAALLPGLRVARSAP